MYGMKKTTIYLPDDVKAALERIAAAEGQSEAELIRAALREKIAALSSSRPTVPLSSVGLGDPTIAERVDELLTGFGGE
jgi:plasmid stability protein